MTPGQVRDLVDWIVKKSQSIDYGEIKVTITKHDGAVRFIERTVSEKMK